MTGYPRVRQEDDSLVLEFAPLGEMSTSKRLKMVLDFDQLGEVIGIEVINFALETGKNSRQLIDEVIRVEGGMRYSYDDDSDSFYLRLKIARSVDQKALEGSIWLDDEGQILSLRADWH